MRASLTLLCLLALLSCRWNEPTSTAPPPPVWRGGSVAAQVLSDGRVAVLDVTWRASTPLLSPDRRPASATVSLRVLRASGEPSYETIVVEGDRANAMGLVLHPSGDLYALVTEPGLPDQSFLYRFTPEGVMDRGPSLGDVQVTKPAGVTLTTDGHIAVFGSTTTYADSEGQLQALEDKAAFVNFYSADFTLVHESRWNETGDQSILALAGDTQTAWFLGTNTPPKSRTGATTLGRFTVEGVTTSQVSSLRHGRALTVDPSGPIAAGWALDGKEGSLPGSTQLLPRVLAFTEAAEQRWQQDGCCASWPHDLDLFLDKQRLVFGGRADAATVRLGQQSAPGGAGVQGFLSVLSVADGEVRSVDTVGKVGDTPMSLPVAVLADTGGRPCLVAGSGTIPQCTQ